MRPGGKHEPAGVLEVTEDDLRLALLGGFDDAEGEHGFDRRMPMDEFSVIHGESSGGTPITLLKSFYSRCEFGGNSLFRKGPAPVTAATLTCNGMLWGTHLSALDDKCFSACRVSIPSLDRWIDDRPFEFKSDHPNVTVRYRQPQKRSIDIPEREVEIRFVPEATTPYEPWDDVTISHRTCVEIHPNEPREFNWFVRMVGDLENLFTLLFGNVVQSSQTTLVGKDDRENADVWLLRERLHQPKLNPHEFIFRLPDIEESFHGAVANWFSGADEIRQSLSLFFSTVRYPGRNLESRFLPLVQALEVYSRAVDQRTIVDKAHFRPVRKQLMAAIPSDIRDDLRDAITRSLGFANERTLRERFSSLVECLSDDTKNLFCVDANEFIKGVVNTRNHLTHYSKHSKFVLKGMALHWASLKIQTMMKILLLLRLGIPEAKLCSLIGENYQLGNERKAWKSETEVGDAPDQLEIDDEV